ncbi:hypothetical protein EVAR_89637_1 [Eumeta japonica]|uniref:Uncharacterized protein n=1 Tax=Eumeta variegata TaxID=151549 RepID=A0A4C1ZBE4_EUMVA|nr:hypothetical protein EVAR_89637_1 [Eumeta japonica]
MGRLCYLVGRDELDDKSDDFDSFTECGRMAHECRRRVTCAMDDAWWKSSRHRMSQETVTGRFPSLLPGRRRLAAAGWMSVLCVQVCDAEPLSDVPPPPCRHRDPRLRVAPVCASYSAARRHVLRPTAPSREPAPVSSNYRDRPRAARSSPHSAVLRSVRQRPSTRGYRNGAKPASSGFRSRNGSRTRWRGNPKRPAPLARRRARPPTRTPIPDRVILRSLGFTTVRRRRAAKGSKPEAACLTQTPDGSTYYRLTPASRKPKKANVAEATPSVKSTSSIYDSPVSWRTPSQPAAAPQGAVGDGRVKAAAPAAVKNNRGDEADVTAPPTPAPRGPKPPPMFVQNKDRWTELRRRCAEKGIQFSQARNSAQGLKLQAKTVADFKICKTVMCYKFKFHTYSLKEEGNPAEANDKATKAASSKSGAYAPSGVKAEQPCKRATGSVITASPTGTQGHTANYLDARVLQKTLQPRKPPMPARAVSATFSYARAAAGPRNAPAVAKNIATSADDLSQLMSIITIIDTSELAILAKKFRSAANPTEKLLCLVEHASLVEAIKNKLNPIK